MNMYRSSFQAGSAIFRSLKSQHKSSAAAAATTSSLFWFNNICATVPHRSSSSSILVRTFSTSSVTDTATEQLLEDSCILYRRQGIRSVAVIAHVDHGKTTLVDQLLQAAKRSRSAELSETMDRLLDSSDIEKERGITITSKVTRLAYRADDCDFVINCVDTPGHSDFSAEVDRILSMVDGVVLVVDAAEGPKSQTKYVLTRALALGIKPLGKYSQVRLITAFPLLLLPLNFLFSCFEQV
jgi:small GTP-binding protein